MVANEHFNQLQDGQRLTDEELDALMKFASAHPYSSTLAALKTKALMLGESADYEPSLRKAAILSSDRSKLHDFIFETESKENTSTIVESEEKKSESDPLEEQIISAAIGSGAVLDLIDGEPAKETSKESGASSKSEEDTSTEQVSEGPRSFTDWMASLSDPSDNVTSKLSTADSLEIIERFIENEDEVVPKRAEFFSPTKVAKKSTEDNEEIVSETLAKIYAAQGEVNKAISTYNKLSLLHPEKSSYFAALIQKLKEDKNI